MAYPSRKLAAIDASISISIFYFCGGFVGWSFGFVVCFTSAC